MCTSFIKKTKDSWLICMNFDNNGMKYFINTKKKDWFIVYVDIEKTKRPSFGVHKSGIFFNDLCVDSNGKGNYRRSSDVTHTAKLLLGIIDGKIDVENLSDFLSQTEIVNVPNLSTHNMICTEKGDVWIIEPGRGNKHIVLNQNEFYVMTNDALLDLDSEEDITCDRDKKVKEVLSKNKEFKVSKAFDLLEEVVQNGNKWITDLSIVFNKKENVVYYVEQQKFDDIKKYVFK